MRHVLAWCSAHTCHVAKVRLSTDGPHRVVIPRITPEYQYPWIRFYCASLFPACWMLHHLLTWWPLHGCQRLSHCRPQVWQLSLLPRHCWRRPRALPRASALTSPPPLSLRLGRGEGDWTSRSRLGTQIKTRRS
jgi:hypothetical protein